MNRNMTVKGFIYLTKALCEIKNTNEVGRRIGLELSNENDISDVNQELVCLKNCKINTYYAMRPVERLIMSLSNSGKEVSEESLVCDILLSLAHMNNLLGRFESVGISIDCDTFDGHFYSAISALSKALDYFTGISSDDDEAHVPIDTVSLDNHAEVVNFIVKQYGFAIREGIRRIQEEWRYLENTKL